MTPRSVFVALLLFFVVARARADIVWDGRTVTSWPEGAYDSLPSDQSFAKFYPSPKGEVWGLTILVDFSDQAPAFTKTQIDAWLNQKDYDVGGLNGSVRDYYADVSNGMVDLRNDVVGFYRAKNPKSYYEGGSGYARAEELFKEVIAAIDPMVDFAKYDNDGNGSTDAISIVYAGEAETWGQGLWPHASNSSVRADGVTLSRHMMTALRKKLALYTFCHEVGHMLFGWPDLYGFGDYCLMGNATDPVDPAGINDFFRADQGWIPELEITSDMNARAQATSGGSGYRYTNPADSGECFFWSNIQNRGRWHLLRGSGLLFFHYKKSIRTNTPPNPLALAVVQADGRMDLDKTQWPSPGSDAKDFFVGGGVAEFSDSTRPNAHWMDGSNSGLRVYDIGASGDTIRFSVGKKAPTEDLTPPDAGVADAGAKDGGQTDAGVAEMTPDASVETPADTSDGGVDASSAPVRRDAGVAKLDASPEVPAETEEPRARSDDGCAVQTSSLDRAWLVALALMLTRRKSSRARKQID